ncbi:NUDIX hydrolase [Nodularia sphaerocarpa]|uniref:NUDIX hydrolase n=1 Tax=Nodularia sphaerocarpa TaxID=137816 RepID=UPI001EFB9F0F|nr:NUDIX hydrolase [Nodularia sphaerocarpa]MDB9374022.1 NUDIX hydrolase [Nodularia sphaerocarpa CS-585]MDB9378520.1 NUDIX hydrolase [Nodularia sphaerocarpa CS-585A2]ULP72434.1 RNA pyrophosphohydrolase [Nodularia sphaerocarpa UHCC 0038]
MFLLFFATVVQSTRNLWRVGQTVLGMIFRHPITGASIIPILPDGRIVLIKRRDDGCWSLPGGMVDWGEDIPQTVNRELIEETGLELVKITRLVGVYSAPDRDPRIHSICVVVEAEVKGKMKIQDTLEVMDIQAFPTDSLPPGKMSHDHTRQLKDYLNGLTTLA